MNYQEKRARIAKWLEYMYLILFGLLAAYLFWGLTSFEISPDFILKTASGENNIISKLFVESPYYLLGIVVLLRYLIQEEYDYKKIILSGLIFLVGRYLWIQNGYPRTLLVLLLVLGARGISFRKMIKIYFTVITSLLLVTVICALGGLIENYTYDTVTRGIRRAFGIAYSTNFASLCFFQVLCWWYLRKEKLTYPEAAIALGIACLLKIFCDARCSSLLLTCTAIAMCWQRFQYQRSQREGREYRMNPVISFILTLAYPLAAVGVMILTILYTEQNELLVKINSLVSSRLFLGRKALDVYGMRLFGQSLRLYSNAEGKSTKFYFYIDSSYVQLAVMYGLIVLGLVLIAFLLISNKARFQKDWIFLLMLALVAAHSIIEQHLIELPYCPFILALFADTDDRRGTGLKEIFGGIRCLKKH